MNDEVDFLEVGKRVPYKAPESFFESFPDSVFKKMERQARRWKRLSILGMAAAVLWIGVLVAVLYYPQQEAAYRGEESLEACIEQLSDQELNVLVELYENDIFLTNN